MKPGHPSVDYIESDPHYPTVVDALDAAADLQPDSHRADLRGPAAHLRRIPPRRRRHGAASGRAPCAGRPHRHGHGQRDRDGGRANGRLRGAPPDRAAQSGLHGPGTRQADRRCRAGGDRLFAAVLRTGPCAGGRPGRSGDPDGRRGRARHLAMGGGRKPVAAGRTPAAGRPLPDVLHRRHDRLAQGRRAYPQFSRLFLPADPRPVAVRVRRRDRPERRADVPYLGPRFHPGLPALHPGDHGDRAAIPAGHGDRATGPAPGQLLRRRAGGDFPRSAGLGRDRRRRSRRAPAQHGRRLAAARRPAAALEGAHRQRDHGRLRHVGGGADLPQSDPRSPETPVGGCGAARDRRRDRRPGERHRGHARRRARRGPAARPAVHHRLPQPAGRDRQPRSATAGSTPAMSAIWTRTATCFSSTARRR